MPHVAPELLFGTLSVCSLVSVTCRSWRAVAAIEARRKPIRLLQFSVIVVVLLVARYALYRWLNAPDRLGLILRQSINALVAYFLYVVVGLVVLSRATEWGFGPDREAAAVLITVATAIYVGLGIAALWLFLRNADRERRRP